MIRVLSRLPDSSMLGLKSPLISQCDGGVLRVMLLLLHRGGQARDPAIVAHELAPHDQLLRHRGSLDGTRRECRLRNPQCVVNIVKKPKNMWVACCHIVALQAA